MNKTTQNTLFFFLQQTVRRFALTALLIFSLIFVVAVIGVEWLESSSTALLHQENDYD